MNKKTQFHVRYWLAAFFGLMLFQYYYATTQVVAPISYSQFQTYLN